MDTDRGVVLTRTGLAKPKILGEFYFPERDSKRVRWLNKNGDDTVVIEYCQIRSGVLTKTGLIKSVRKNCKYMSVVEVIFPLYFFVHGNCVYTWEGHKGDRQERELEGQIHVNISKLEACRPMRSLPKLNLIHVAISYYYNASVAMSPEVA